MKNSERVMIGIAIFAWVGFRVWMRVMNWESSSYRTPTVVGSDFHSQEFVELDVKIKHNITDDEFRGIHRGMNFLQVNQSIHIRMKNNLKEILPNPEKLESHVIYKNPNGSSVEVVFRNDVVVHKEQHWRDQNPVNDDDASE